MKEGPLHQWRAEERGIIIGLAALCIVLVTTTVLLLTAGRRMSALLLEYDASRLASILLEEYVQSEQLYHEGLQNQVIGAGIYDGFGELIRGSGDVPDRIAPAPPLVTDTRVEYDRGSRTVTLIRPVGMPGIIRDRMHRQMERMRPISRRFSFLVRANAVAYFRTRLWYTAGIIVSPVAIVSLMALLGVYYIRTRRYRREGDERERLAQLGETARTIAHEIKNPLNAINVRTRILRQEVLESSCEDLIAIEHEVGRLRRLTDRIGDFLRDPIGEPVALDARERATALVQRHQWPIRIQDDGSDDYRIRFDELRFESVLGNLLSNAVEASNAAGSSNMPALTVSRERNYVVCEVKDEGAGMSQEEIERAFDPFFTTKTTGSGIGLSIVKRFVEAAGGTVEIASSDGGGTVVAIRLREQPS